VDGKAFGFIAIQGNDVEGKLLSLIPRHVDDFEYNSIDGGLLW
jgi:hypothetical protein